MLHNGLPINHVLLSGSSIRDIIRHVPYDDIPLLVVYLIERYATRAGKKTRTINKRTLELFQTYDWPGNIRELQNVIERAVILCESDTFAVEERWLQRESSPTSRPTMPLVAARAAHERALIEAALAACPAQPVRRPGSAYRGRRSHRKSKPWTLELFLNKKEPSSTAQRRYQ